MTERCVAACQLAAAALSVALAGGIGAGLLLRLRGVAAGREPENGLDAGRAGPVCRPGMMAAAGAAVLSRLLLYVLAWGMLRLRDAGAGGVFETLERLWLQWDARHYVEIAQSGYTAVGEARLLLVFFPLYPLLMRAFSVFFGGDVFMGGLLVSLLCSALSAALLFDLGWMHGGKRCAALCTAYFLLSPMSVFLCSAYTEALFICLTLGAVCLLRRRRPWLAALCGAASALTRMPGVIIAGLFIISLIGRAAKKRADARDALACAGQVLLVFSGLFVYWGVNLAVTGDPFMYLTYQRENWFQAPGVFYETVSTTVEYVLTCVGDEDWFFCWVTQLGAIFAFFALLLLRGKRLPFDLAAYSAVYGAVVLAPTWTLSAPRYLFALCALPLAKAHMVKGGAAHGALLALSGALLALYTYGFTIAGVVL